MKAIAAYQRVYTELKRRIKEKVYEPGTLLPTESELEKQFQVNRTTVRKAIGLLAGEGYLNVRQGRGTEVLNISTTQRLNYVSSITETLREKGHVVTTQAMSIERIKPPSFVVDELDLPPEAAVYFMQRVQCADGQPIALMTNYLRENIVPGLDQYANQFVGLYAFLEQRYNIIIKDAWERLSAVSASFTDAQILKIPIGSPLLCSKRISNVEQGPFEYSIIKLVADKYDYIVYLHGRN